MAHDVLDPSDLVAGGVDDGEADHAGDEDLGVLGDHAARLTPRPPDATDARRDCGAARLDAAPEEDDDD
ncbi:hypothetical protein GCM10022275_14670 [Tessaracoccus defluvii]